MNAGADALRERALVRGYEEFAEMWPEVHDADDARERRRRYAEHVTDA